MIDAQTISMLNELAAVVFGDLDAVLVGHVKDGTPRGPILAALTAMTLREALLCLGPADALTYTQEMKFMLENWREDD